MSYVSLRCASLRYGSAARALMLALALTAAFPSLALAAGGPRKLPPKPAHTRLDSVLNGLVEQVERKALSAEAVARQAAFSRGGAVAVTILTAGDVETMTGFLEERGATVVNSAPGVVEAYVALTSLAEVGEHPDVLAVRGILPPQPLGFTSQGTILHGSVDWNDAGILGTGVKVGVIDVGFTGYSSLIGEEVPAPQGLRCYTDVGSFTSKLSDCETETEHGTAVTEAVVDIAPETGIYLANPKSALDLRTTVQWMASQGVRVINYSVGNAYDGPGDGTSPFPESSLRAVDIAVQSGIVWVNAAGNEAEKHWRGPFTDSNGDDFLEFAGGVDVNALQLAAGSVLIVECRWEDTWGLSSRDLDLLLTNAAGEIVAAGSEEQSGQPGQAPYEVVVFPVQVSGTYGLSIGRFSGARPGWVQLHVFSQGTALARRTASYSISNPAESRNPGMLAVGAAAWSTPDQIESYSSQGPTSDGRIKPDLAGADRGDSAVYGPNGFTGTSQASPHVAGLAALVRQAFPAATPVEVVEFLKATAIPIGSKVPNNVFGAGFAHLPPPTAPGACTPSATAMCLAGDRFQVEVSWRNSQGGTGSGQAVRLTGDSGYFWFFNAANIEMVIKVIDGCGLNNRYWVFAGGLTNVKVDIRITDTATGVVRTYANPLGVAFAPIQDTSAFATCP